MQRRANLIPRFQLRLANAQTDAEIIQAYFEFASAHGAHSDISREVWDKVQNFIKQASNKVASATPHKNVHSDGM